MKVALCFSGQPRCIDYGYKFINNTILKQYNPDIFIHTWWNNDNDINRVWNWKHEECKDDLNSLSDNNTLNKIKKLYKPIKMNIEKEYVPKTNLSYIKCLEGSEFVYNMYSMFNSIYKSNELKKEHEKKNKFKYDVVIRCRFDIALMSHIDFNKLDMNYIYTKKYYVPRMKKNPFEVNDHFAFSNSNNMDIYSNVYYNINNIYINNKIRFLPEFLLGKQIVNNNIKHRRIDFESFIVRGIKNGKWHR